MTPLYTMHTYATQTHCTIFDGKITRKNLIFYQRKSRRKKLLSKKLFLFHLERLRRYEVMV